MSPRTGRPHKENPRNEDLNIRLTSQEKAEIQAMADLLGISRTDAIMRGIALLRTETEKK